MFHNPESKANFLKVKGKQTMVLSPPVTSGHIICNLPLGKSGFAKFGIKMESSSTTMNQQGSVVKSDGKIRLLMGVQVLQIGLTVPLEIPNEIVHIATGLACVAGLGYGLYKWFRDDDKEDDDVLKEEEDEELKKLTKKYRELFKQKVR